MDFHGLRLALLCYFRLADRKEVYMGLDCNVVTAQRVFTFFPVESVRVRNDETNPPLKYTFLSFFLKEDNNKQATRVER